MAYQNLEKEKRAKELTIANRNLKLIEEELLTTNKEFDAFSYAVSHDLRAPLRKISCYSTILKEDYGSQLNEEANEVIHRVVDSAKKMGQLIDALLNYSQLGRLEVIQSKVEMNRIVAGIIEEISETKNLTKHYFTIHTLPVCKGDRKMLTQVWYNLIENVIKYSANKENPLIDIGCDEDENNYVYYIIDNGVGFNTQYADKPFHVFQRLHGKNEFEGTGVGLSLVKRIIEKHEGNVFAISTLNEGSKFSFSIPK